jgi:hypothetical protein
VPVRSGSVLCGYIVEFAGLPKFMGRGRRGDHGDDGRVADFGLIFKPESADSTACVQDDSGQKYTADRRIAAQLVFSRLI